MLRHTRSVCDKLFEVWRSPGRFTKNPDIVELPSGRLMLIYNDTDCHWPEETQFLTLLASDDHGCTWSKYGVVDTADLRSGDERFVTPRLSALSAGRLAVLIDHDDHGHFHENLPSGNWAYWSSDGGDTWHGPQVTGILGFEPDRMVELPDGRLAVCSHLMRADSQEFANVITFSEDEGKAWGDPVTVAHDGYHRFCEGALVVLDDGPELACVMRENHNAGIPSFVAFSQDMGHTWCEPRMLPFAFERPYAKQLSDGRILVTGRNVNGGLGTYAWCGDLREVAGTYAPGGPESKYLAKMTQGALEVEGHPDYECRYTLLPPESARSEVVFEAVVKVDGDDDQPVALMSVAGLGIGQHAVLHVAPNWICLGDGGGAASVKPRGRPGTIIPPSVDFHKFADMTTYRTLTMHLRQGILEVRIDGKTVLRTCVFGEGGGWATRTQFGQSVGRGTSWWRNVSYSAKNPTLDDFSLTWRADSSDWPDQYQRDHFVQIHANHPDQKPWPDHGYSSWVQLADGRILVVDYTNCGDEPGTSHLVGVHLELQDIQ